MFKWWAVAVGFFVMWIVWHYNMPSSVTAGSQTDIVVSIFLIGLALLSATMNIFKTSRYTRKSDGSYESTVTKLSMPDWMKNKNSYAYRQEQRRVNLNAYRGTVHSALNQRRDVRGRRIT